MQTRRRTSRRLRRHRIIAGVLAGVLAVLIFALSHIPAKGLPSGPGFLSSIAHFCEYLVFASLFTVAFTGGRHKTWHVLMFSIVCASLYGILDEFHQSFVPGRTPDPMDWLVDTLGASIGALISTFVLRKIDSQISPE